MGTRTINRTWRVEGVLTNVTSAKLSDPTGAYGVKRNDTDAVVVADGTSMTNSATGIYEYSFTDVQDVAYTAYVEIVYSGATYYFEVDLPARTTVDGMVASYTNLLERVGHFLFGLRSGFTSDQTDDIEMCIGDGLRRVYTAHNWSFFKPLVSVTTVAGTSVYNLPTGYYSIDSEFSYGLGLSDYYPPLQERHDTEILRRQQDDNETGRPLYFSVRTVVFDSTVGSRNQLILYPTPDDAYSISAKMTLRPVSIDSVNQYPVGAEQLAAVILESCLYSAEVNMDDNPGIHAKQFMELLPLAIASDLRASTPKTLGGDAPAGETCDTASRWLRIGDISYDGVVL